MAWTRTTTLVRSRFKCTCDISRVYRTLALLPRHEVDDSGSNEKMEGMQGSRTCKQAEGDRRNRRTRRATDGNVIRRPGPAAAHASRESKAP